MVFENQFFGDCIVWKGSDKAPQGKNVLQEVCACGEIYSARICECEEKDSACKQISSAIAFSERKRQGTPREKCSARGVCMWGEILGKRYVRVRRKTLLVSRYMSSRTYLHVNMYVPSLIGRSGEPHCPTWLQHGQCAAGRSGSRQYHCHRSYWGGRPRRDWLAQPR